MLTQHLYVSSEEEDALRSCLCDLPHREFKAVFLRFWGPRSISDIAAELRISWDQADRLLNRALARLRVASLLNQELESRARDFLNKGD